jgi:osmotically-inducible protein OsmY
MKTDRQIQQDVSAELDWEPSVHAARIGVEVKDGVVTLAGQVDSYAEKWNAERAAQRVSGVKALATELQVQLTSLGQRTDADIAAAVENLLEWTMTLPTGAIRVVVEAALKRTAVADARHIAVQVHGGDVTLTGTVRNWDERETATHAAWGTPGVRNVVDRMTLVY